MRISILATAAITAFALPVFAQDRTLPAGAYLAAQPPIDTLGALSTPTLEGRSVALGGERLTHKRTRHHAE